MSKMDWKKRILGLMTASAALTLAACGANAADGDSSATSGAAADGKTLTVAIDPMYAKFVDSIKGDFEKENGVKVEVTEGDMFDTLEALPLDGPAGIGPDVMLAPYDRIGGLGLQGHLMEVTLPDDNRYDETDKKQVTADGKIYGSPFVIESLILYYNKDLIAAAPTTFAELEALTKDERFAFAAEKGKSTAFLANWVDFYNSYGLLAGYGGYVFGADGTDPSDIGLNSPKAVEGITYATKWFKEVWPQGMLDSTSAGNFIDEQFNTGKTAAIINGPWGASTYKEAGVNYGVATIPTLPNGNAYAPFAGGKGWVTSAYTDEAALAQAWLDYVTNEANMMALFSDFTSEIPANQMARTAVAEAGDDELAVAVIKQYNTAVPMPNIPEMAEVWTGAATMMFDAGSGNKTAQESADNAVSIIKQNIEQKY